MSTTPSFPALLQRFFTQRLMQQRHASPHTIGSYRDSFRLLLHFAQARLGKPPTQLAFDQFDAPLIAAFLEDLQKRQTRRNTVRYSAHTLHRRAFGELYNFLWRRSHRVGAAPVASPLRAVVEMRREKGASSPRSARRRRTILDSES